MRYTTMDTTLLVFLALVATATAVPLSSLNDDNKCSAKCTGSSNFRYSTGTTYTYDYSVETTTSIAGASEDQARLTLHTNALIQVLSPCEFSLQLTNTRLFHSEETGILKMADREAQFRSGLEAYSLRFSFQDGKIEQVCPSTNDDAWALNLKKGLLSAFQNSMEVVSQSQNVTETDVVGTCKTAYTVMSNGYYVTSLKKSKDILTCTDRHNFETMIQATPYLIPSDIQSLPLMKTTHECEQSIEVGGVLKSSICSESHVYRPFANGMSGGSTTVTQKLTYQTYKRSVSSRAGSVESRDTLIFDHKATQPNKDQARRSVEQKLGDICDNTVYDIRPESPRLFTELTIAMRTMDADDMEDIYRLLKTKTMCPSNDRTYKFFLDALPMTNTGASVRVMAKLINNGDVEGLQANAWLTSLAFIAQPTSEMILDMKRLIDSEKVREDAILPVSSLINNYCKKQSSCEQDYAVLSIVLAFERTIGYRCDASGKKFNEILLTLRAIGNAGHATRAVNILNKCMTMTSNPMEIRVAAIEAFRRMPCSAEDMNLWELFMDRNMDSELRISAYMAIMRCPSERTLGKMASLLSKEENEQVGSFVYSHLTNLRDSSNPHKQQVADMINNLALNKDFDLGLFKVSRNYEVSTLINKLNTGFTAESNMIWSSSDQMPRSLSGNLTVELFGQSINIFDFGGRLEGLEYLMKSVLGPYINANEKTEKENDFDNVQGSVFGRVFGNEMFFVHSKTAKSPLGKMPSKWLNVLIKLAKKQELALTQNFQFIDACMVIPSSAGLPVQIHVNGTATVDLSVNGKMDLRKVGVSPRSMDVDGEVKPSAALEVTGTMAVDAFVTKTGLCMRNTLHSSSSLKGRIQLNRGQQLNIELDTPEDKMEIFGAKSQFYILHNDVEQEQEMIKENRKEFKKCTGATFASITGLEMCEELSFANASLKSDGPYFPLTGPSSFSVTLFKRDTHSRYKIFAKRTENKKMSIAQFSVNTPGSKVNRAITMDMTLNYAKQSMEINMFSPWKKTEMKGDLMNKNGMKSISGRIVIDDVNVYALTSEVKTVQGKNKIQFSPMIEMKRPGADNVQLLGLIAFEQPWKSMNMDMSLTGIQKLPYNLKSTIVNSKKVKSLAASFSTDNKNVYSIEASNQMSVMGKKSTIASMKTKFNVNTPKTQLISVAGSGNYRQDKSLKMDTTVAIHRVMKRPASLKVSLVKNAKKKGSRYDVDVLLKSSKINVRIDSNMFTKPNGFISTKSSFDYNIPKVHRNKIIFNGKLNDRSTKALKKYSVRGTVDVKRNPEYNMGIILDVDHKKKHSEIELDLKYGPNPKDKTKKIYLLTSLTKKIAKAKNAAIDYKIKAQAPEHNIDVFLGGKHTHTPKSLDSKVQLKYGNNKGINAGLVLRDQSSKLTKMNGKMNVEWPGTEYMVNTQLVQKSAKQYQHTLNFKSNDGTKHSLTTIYKRPKSIVHDVRTELNLHKHVPITVSGSTTLNPRNFAATGKLTSGKDIYGFVTSSKISKAPNAKINVELIHPARRMTLAIDGGKAKSKYQGSVEASWDADKKESKVVLDGAYMEKSKKGVVSLGGNLNLRSPFENFEDLFTSFKYGADMAQHNIDGKLSWGGKQNQIVSKMSLKKDLSLRNIDFTMGVKTPFKGFRNAEINVDHNLADALNTMINGNVERDHVKIVLQGQDNSDDYKTDIKGNMALKSNMKSAKSITAAFSHSLNGGKLTTSADMTHNGKKYEGAINVAHSGNGLNFKNNGDLTVKVPKQKITTKWAHKNTDNSMKGSLISSWGKDTLKVDFSGTHELSNLRQLNGDLNIKSPWTAARNIEFSLNHKHGNGLVNSDALLKQNGKTKVSSKVNFKADASAAGADFELTAPMLEDLSGKVNAQYDKYPITSSAEMSWAPKKKVTVEGSLNLATLEDADINVKLTTPSHKYRNVLVKASNKITGDEAVSHLVFDYGVRKSIDFESRVGFGEQKKSIRVKLMSPFESLKSLESGMSFDGHIHNFESKADFELLPSLGKFDANAQWQYNTNLAGKIRVNTPFQDYQYFELSTSSVLKPKNRQNRLQLEHYPRKVYSFDSTYRFDVPLSFQATIRSPFPEYDNLGMAIQHNHGNSFVSSHGEITYQPGKTIESDLNANWDKDMDGSLVVKTPFQDFETNQITLRHKSQKGLFSTHGKASVAKKDVVVDLNADWNKNVAGSLVVKTPFQGFETNQITLRHKSEKGLFSTHGKASVAKKDVVVDLNADWNKNVAGSLVVKTPFQDFETNQITLRHKAKKGSFSTHGEAFIALKKVVVDASLKTGYVTSGTFIFTSPIPGMENIKATLKKRGNADSLKGGIVLNVNKEKAQLNFNHKLSRTSMKSGLSISTPYTHTLKLSVDHTGPVDRFTNKMSLNYGRKVDVDSEASFTLREANMIGNAMLKYKLGKGKNTAKIVLQKNGPIEDLSFSGSASLNRDDISISGTWKTVGEIDGSVTIKTPFKNFKTTGMTMNHKGNMKAFQSNANVNYMDGKHIYGNVEFSNREGQRMKFSSKLTTPFKALKSSSFEFNNEIDEMQNRVEGNIVLSTTLNKFGTGKIVYTKSGDINNLMVDTSAMRNGKDMATLTMANNFNQNELHSKFDLKTVATPAVLLTVDHSGDVFSFNTKTVGTVGKNTVSGEANMKRDYQSFDADGSVLYKSGNRVENKCSVNVHTDGNWEQCNLRVSGILNDDEVKLTTTRQGALQDMTFGGMASYNGKSIDITGLWRNQADVDGKIDIQTPFKNFNNVGLTLSHSGDASKFTSSATLNYMDNKKITGNVDLTADSMEDIKFSTSLAMPSRNLFDLKFNNQYDRFTTSIEGNMALYTPLADGTKAIRYSKTGNLNNLKIEVVTSDNGVEASSLKISNDYYGKELHSIFDFKSVSLPEMLFAVDHEGGLTNMNTKAEAKFGKKSVITGQAKFNARENVIDCEGKFMYNVVSLGSNEGSMKIHKEGQMNDMTFDITANAGNKMSKLNGNFKNTDELSLAMQLTTPVKGFRDVGLSFKHSGSLDRFNCDGMIKVMDGKTFTGKIDFYRYLLSRIEAVVEVTTPIKGFELTKYEYRHEGREDNFKCYSTLEYGNSKKIVYDLTASGSPNPDFKLTITAPDMSLTSSGSVEYTWPKYGIKGRFDAEKGRVLTIDGSLDATSDIIGALNINTPMEGFTDVGFGFSFSPRNNGMESRGQITYMDGKTISANTDIALSKKGRSQLSAELRTPFAGFELSKIEQVHIVNRKMMRSTTTLVYKNDRTIVYEMNRKLSPKQELTVSLKTPFEKYEELMAYISLDSTSPKYELNGKIVAGNGNDFGLTGSIDVSDDYSGALKIETPYEGFTDIGMDFLHSGNVDKFGTEGKVTYMDGKDISGKVSFYRYMWRRITASAELNTPFSGMEFTKTEINFEDNTNSISTTTTLEYCDGKKFNGVLKLTYSPNYDMMLTLNTPFKDYKLIRTQGSLDLTAPSYEMTYRMDDGRNKIYSATGKLNLNSLSNVEASVEVNTPITDYRYTKADYNHKVDTSEVDVSMSLLYKNGQTMSADLRSSLSPNFDATLTVKTPFSGFENMQGNAVFDKSYNRYEASSSLNLGSGNLYSMSSDIDYSSFPMRASAKVNTPFTDFQNMELTLTHDGELTNFVSTGHFNSPLTNDVNAKASLKYDSLFDMEATVSLQSAMSGFDDLKAEAKMSTAAGGRKAHLLMGWTNGQEIIMDSTYHLQQSWYENKVSSDLSISTPFTAIRSLAWQMEAVDNEDAKSGKTTFELNDVSLLDIDGEYKLKDKKEIQITLRQPRSMMYTASMSRDGETSDAEVFVNWNRNELDSNVRVQATMTDKSNDYRMENNLDIKLVHASRQFGLVHKINADAAQTSSGGNIYWDSDDSSKVFYDVKVNDNSRRHKQIIDGSLKFGFPSRTLGLISSYSGNKATKAADVTFSWDADRDDSKQVGVKATVNRGDGIKGDVTLSLPSLRKEIRVDGEVMMKNGRILFDAKTDFSYSRDARKTLTLTSKLEDISDYYSHFNYSMSLGVSHPYTNVDVQIKSHVGCSDERTTFGMGTNYMTAKRQMKNLALLTEINKIKKQINLQVTSPINKVEIVGDVISASPYKARVINKINGIETFRSDMTVDQNKKSFVLNAFRDTEGVTVSAKYPNNTAFQAELIHHSLPGEHRDALLAVRLNTSRLMHTRLSWRPEMVEDLNVLFLEKVVEDALNVRMALSEINEVVKDEISAKYVAIADEVADELKPFIAALNVELSGIAVRISELSAEMRAMYSRNDFYIQSMTDEFMYLEEKFASMTQVYRQNYRQLIQTMTQSLRDMRTYPIHEKYTQAVKESAEWVDQQVSLALTWLESMLEEMDKTIQQYQVQVAQAKQQALDTVYNATYVDYLSNRIGQIGESINLKPYVSSFEMPEEYTNAIYNARSSVMSSVGDFLDKSQAGHMKEGMNEVYQQGLWAYHYWQLEENIRKHSHSIIKTLKEIIKDEIKEFSEELQFFVKNPITVWDPKRGEIQADLPLPNAMRRLDEVPDFSPLVKRAKEMAVLYLPDKTTLNEFVKSITDTWSDEEKSQETKNIKNKQPAKKFHKKGRKFRVRHSGQ